MKNKKFVLIGLITIAISYFSFQTPFFEIAKQIEIYNNMFKVLNMNYIDEINPGDITNASINYALKNLDPYTRFYNEQQMEDAKIRREGEYGGVGINCSYTKQGIIVSKIKEGYPADKAGLKAGDVIFEVNGENLIGLATDQLSQQLKGTPNTKITVKLNRGNEVLTKDITLDKIVIKAVPFYQMINEDTGYLILTRFFNQKSTKEVKAAIKALKEQGMKKLVFDLRNNPGGSLYDAVNITNLFIPKGKKVVDTRGKTKKNSRTYKTSQEPLDTEIPLVILINGKSASASEIVSGALQDYDRAVVIGERSYGKGLVQRYFNLNYGTQMKATISKYYTPSGRCIQELDYANRDPKTKKVPKFSDGPINEYKTENGRSVFDGGGVLPDIISKPMDINQTTKKLFKSRAIFNFCTDYLRNKEMNPDAFSFNETDFTSFKNYLKNTDSTFVTKQESLFKKAYKSLDDNQIISADFENLSQKLAQVKIDKINQDKDAIVSKIENEIIERLVYTNGLYKSQFKKDKTIIEAVTLLENTEKYQAILNK